MAIRLSKNAQYLLQKRYLQKNRQGKVIETPKQLFRRVAKSIAQADLNYVRQKKDFLQTEQQFYQLLSSLDFLPNSPTLMNAGTKNPQLAACFVLPIEDSLDSIFQTLHQAAIIHKYGGGTGFDFSSLRSQDAFIEETGGKSSGPVSFIKAFDCATEQIKQGGKRRGANMAILRIDHFDIEDFITCKQRCEINNFNFSVAITDRFIEALQRKRPFYLVDPHTKKKIKRDPRKLFSLLCQAAWQTGDPGVVFIDTINKHHPLPKQKITATNPCGEQPLLPYESCNLGSINLANHVADSQIDWIKLRKTVQKAVHFLDNVIDLSDYIFPKIDDITKQNRKIGLGVMGFADLLIRINVSYSSSEAARIAENIMEFISFESAKASQRLAEIRGAFPNFKESVHKRPQRNATLTTIAPTGSLSIIAGCSSGIEPLFALAYTRRMLSTKEVSELNYDLLNSLRKAGLNKKNIIRKIAKQGSLQGIEEIPDYIRKLFVTALEIIPEEHLAVQAAFQKHTDNAVSKTINLPQDTAVKEVEKIFLAAHHLGCKGLTVYRYGSKEKQVLTFGCKICDEVKR